MPCDSTVISQQSFRRGGCRSGQVLSVSQQSTIKTRGVFARRMTWRVGIVGVSPTTGSTGAARPGHVSARRAPAHLHPGAIHESTSRLKHSSTSHLNLRQASSLKPPNTPNLSRKKGTGHGEKWTSVPPLPPASLRFCASPPPGTARSTAETGLGVALQLEIESKT